jgi:hypothetical protein
MVEEKNQQEQQQIQLNLSTIFREKISIFLCMYVYVYVYVYIYLSGISLYHVTASRSDMLKVFLPPEISNKEFQNQLH